MKSLVDAEIQLREAEKKYPGLWMLVDLMRSEVSSSTDAAHTKMVLEHQRRSLQDTLYACLRPASAAVVLGNGWVKITVRFEPNDPLATRVFNIGTYNAVPTTPPPKTIPAAPQAIPFEQILFIIVVVAFFVLYVLMH